MAARFDKAQQSVKRAPLTLTRHTAKDGMETTMPDLRVIHGGRQQPAPIHDSEPGISGLCLLLGTVIGLGMWIVLVWGAVELLEVIG
jgi:hypothetical protein